ncbi:Lrp/AsnC family transcriptional regulator [Paracoccus yeei]|uniref:Lrp/AsnC family transcriptional regulator n=1 Tax=Paracoccus yeei TaxID=147645 RepID=UPI003BF9175C
MLKLDRIDIRIVHELQRNGRITNVELADLVHLSPSPCLMRVKKLQQAGFITGYSAQVDVAKLGPTLTVFTEVTLKNMEGLIDREIGIDKYFSFVVMKSPFVKTHLPPKTVFQV